MAAVAPHRTDYGLFCVWKYNGPGKRARGFWHGDSPINTPLWAYALRSYALGPSGYWETSKAKGGFLDESSAIIAAKAAVAQRKQP
jgi:hypothetical protein